jgi:ribosomal protein L7/L12
MSKTFNCPACGVPMEYDGKTTLFQTCKSCGAPIVVPSDVVGTSRDEEIESIVNMPNSKANYATEFENYDNSPPSINDPKVIANARIFEEINAGNKIMAIKLHREAFGTDLRTAKEAVETLESEIAKSNNLQTQEAQKDFTNLDKDAVISEIYSELQAGRKINAIKIYRENFDCGLAEAKEAVEKLETQNRYAIKGFPEDLARTTTASIGSNSELGLVINEIRQGNKINAIKVFRETFNTGLKEAKDAVDAMERGEKINVSDYL